MGTPVVDPDGRQRGTDYHWPIRLANFGASGERSCTDEEIDLNVHASLKRPLTVLLRVSLSNTRVFGPDYEHIMRRIPPSWAFDPAMLCIDLPNK